MSQNNHEWEMTNIQFGFIVYEKCYQTNELRTFFSIEDNPILGDRYREGRKHWTRMENAQSFRFDLKCKKTGELVKFNDLMGLMYCTGCLPDCELDKLRLQYEAANTMVIVAFGFFPESLEKHIPPKKLGILTDYFNQRRNSRRSRIKVLPFNLIKDLSKCRGEFLHDVNMLTKEPPAPRRKPLFE
ncbi:MAG TPA: hypothetical protein ENN22_13350 [bacterium]|nr:hypothetical protein [bacterium]HDQ00153.1 hypothetical protein [bacterium]